VGFVVFGEVERGGRFDAASGEGLLDLERNPELLAEPDRHGHHERAQAAGRDAEIGLEDAVELRDGLVVEGDGVEFARVDAGLGEAVLHRVDGKARVVLLAGEPLLLRRGDDVPVRQQCRRAVVVEGRYAEDAHPWRPVRTACR